MRFPCDIKLKRKELLALSDSKVLEMLQNVFPKRGLFSISLDWRNNEKYILKARGTFGDALIGWSGKDA